MAQLNAFFVFCLCILVLTTNGASIRGRSVTKPKGFGSAKHAVIIGIDGLGGVYLKNTIQYYPAMHSFLSQGAYTFQARGVFPTFSGPNWMGYLSGMGPMETGIFDNKWEVKNGDPPTKLDYSIPPVTGRGLPRTIFRQIKEKDRNKKTGMMFTWETFKILAENNTDIDEWFWSGKEITCGPNEDVTDCYVRKDISTMSQTLKFITENKPLLTFVHLDAVDGGGHKSCWGCSLYFEVVWKTEQQIKRFLDTLLQTNGTAGNSLLEDTIVVVVSDHGGWKDTHSSEQPFEALIDIPIFIRGPGIKKGTNLETIYVSSLDVPVTVLNALGVEKNEFMKGRVLEDIYN